MPGNDPEPSRGPGRPRIWASDAERKRAYRARRAAELAEPLQLRRELRSVRRRIGELEQVVTSLQRDLGRAQRALERTAGQRDQARADAEKLRKEKRALWERFSGGRW